MSKDNALGDAAIKALSVMGEAAVPAIAEGHRAAKECYNTAIEDKNSAAQRASKRFFKRFVITAVRNGTQDALMELEGYYRGDLASTIRKVIGNNVFNLEKELLLGFTGERRACDDEGWETSETCDVPGILSREDEDTARKGMASDLKDAAAHHVLSKRLRAGVEKPRVRIRSRSR